MNLLILGTGSFGKMVKETAIAVQSFTQVRLLTDYEKEDKTLECLEKYEQYAVNFHSMFPAIEDNKLRMQWIEKLEESAILVPRLIHPTAYISPYACVQSASLIGPRAVLHTDAYVEKGCVIGANAVIDHNVFIGYGCTIGAGATVEAGSVVKAMTSIKSGNSFRKTEGLQYELTNITIES